MADFHADAGRMPAPRAEYPDGRPGATRRLPVTDSGVVLRHGDAPRFEDQLGARDVWVFEADGGVYMHYDAAGRDGWLLNQAFSRDGISWEKRGPLLELGRPGTADSGSASYGTVFRDEDTWHMFYVGTPHTSPAPHRIPALPYATLHAISHTPSGPWVKQEPAVPRIPLTAGTYHSHTAAPGPIFGKTGEYMQFFSAASSDKSGDVLRTIGIARTSELKASAWLPDPSPILPVSEQIENVSIVFEDRSQHWLLFTNHVGLDSLVSGTSSKADHEYTDAIWMYWSRELENWSPADKAVVLDGKTCTWSSKVIGLPSVIRRGSRLAIYYDGLAKDPLGSMERHMHRDIALAWLDITEDMVSSL